MHYVIGFFIALFIALTGVGAGTITVPVLVLFLGVPAQIAVGIGLMFSTAVKLILVPAQIVRRNVVWRTRGHSMPRMRPPCSTRRRKRPDTRRPPPRAATKATCALRRIRLSTNHDRADMSWTPRRLAPRPPPPLTCRG